MRSRKAFLDAKFQDPSESEWIKTIQNDRLLTTAKYDQNFDRISMGGHRSRASSALNTFELKWDHTSPMQFRMFYSKMNLKRFEKVGIISKNTIYEQNLGVLSLYLPFLVFLVCWTLLNLSETISIRCMFSCAIQIWTRKDSRRPASSQNMRYMSEFAYFSVRAHIYRSLSINLRLKYELFATFK
jgi:hypothetical protein